VRRSFRQCLVDIGAAERMQRVLLHPGLQVPRTILPIGAQGAPYIFGLIRAFLELDFKTGRDGIEVGIRNVITFRLEA